MKYKRKMFSGFVVLLTLIFSMQGFIPVQAQDRQPDVKRLEEMVVKEEAGAPGLEVSPAETVIKIDEFNTIGPQTSVLDVLKTQSIVDLRGETELDPGVDSIYLRGFGATRFVTAIDQLTVQKTGGRKSSNIVDYALLPTFLVDKIEILPGPHSALYDSKSIGGALNFVSKRPERREDLKPDISLSSGFGSYGTMNNNAVVRGAVNAFTYDLAYRKYDTDGFLRHNETDIDTFYGRMGFLLPLDGFVTLSTSYSVVGRNAPVNNPGQVAPYLNDYDPNFPTVTKSSWDPVQNPTWDGRSVSYRLNWDQPSPLGHLTFGAYYGKDNRERAYEEWSDKNDHSAGTYHTVMDTDWWQQGGKIQDEVKWKDNHITTIGYDTAKLYDEGVDNTKTERINKNGAYIQHQWGITPSVDLKLGMRYEDVKIWTSNWSNGSYHIPGREKYIERSWDHLVPKSFLTWKMNGLAAWLRDTSLSVGISKIWHAPDYHGDYNPQGRPAGAWIEPEHGMGFDLILDRRMWRDITLKLGYAFYEIQDFIATNSSYANFTPRGSVTYGALNYSDYKINLQEVHRHGVDLDLGGHLTDKLSFYLGYAWQTFNNKGNEPTGETSLDQRAEHRVSSGLQYELFEKTRLMLDYYYQSEETTEISEEIAPDVWTFREVDLEEYHVFDLGLQHSLFKEQYGFKSASFKFYIKNLFNKQYYSSSGYQATDRFFGASLNFRM